jgi:hypothetical protein
LAHNWYLVEVAEIRAQRERALVPKRVARSYQVSWHRAEVSLETEKVARSRSNNIAIVAITLFAFAVATPASVGAQNLASFGILAGPTITNTGPSVINGTLA